jgi:hypothetical protein
MEYCREPGPGGIDHATVETVALASARAQVERLWAAVCEGETAEPQAPDGLQVTGPRLAVTRLRTALAKEKVRRR